MQSKGERRLIEWKIEEKTGQERDQVPLEQTARDGTQAPKKEEVTLMNENIRKKSRTSVSCSKYSVRLSIVDVDVARVLVKDLAVCCCHCMHR